MKNKMTQAPLSGARPAVKTGMRAIPAVFFSAILLICMFAPGAARSKDAVKVDCGVVFHDEFRQEALDLQALPDGRVMIGGLSHMMPDQGQQDGWIRMLNTDGSEIWTQDFGEAFHDAIMNMATTSDGGILAVGRTQLDEEEDYDGWLVKLDAEGAVEWDAAYGEDDGDVGLSVVEAENGGYVVAGMVFKDDSPVWVFKVDEQGDYVWENHYYLSRFRRNNILGVRIVRTPDAGYLLYGNVVDHDAKSWESGARNSDPSAWDVWFMKIDDKGQQVWSSDWGQDGNEQPVMTVISDAEVTEDEIRFIGATQVEKENANPLLPIASAMIELPVDSEDGNAGEPRFLVDANDSGYSLSQKGLSSISGRYVLAQWRDKLFGGSEDMVLITVFDPQSGQRVAGTEFVVKVNKPFGQIVDLDQDEAGNYYVLTTIDPEFSGDKVHWIAAFDEDLNCIW